jgi:hypothetical protein
MGAGYPINWAPTGNQAFTSHPLYVKYNSTTFANINVVDVKTDLSNVLATADNAEICSYLSWLVRTISLTI